MVVQFFFPRVLQFLCPRVLQRLLIKFAAVFFLGFREVVL
jgi:hypothetical protein